MSKIKIENIKEAANRVRELEEIQESIKHIGRKTKMLSMSFKPTYQSSLPEETVKIPKALSVDLRLVLLNALKEWEEVYLKEIEGLTIE